MSSKTPSEYTLKFEIFSDTDADQAKIKNNLKVEHILEDGVIILEAQRGSKKSAGDEVARPVVSQY